MKRWFVFAVLLAACGKPASTSTGWTTEGDAVRCTDPIEKERLKGLKGLPSPDLRTIALRSDGAELHVIATFNDPWSACFDTEEFGDIVLEMWVDSDADKGTGGVLLGGTATGFERCLKATVMSDIDWTGGEPRLTGYSASYGVTEFRQGEDEFDANKRTTIEELKAQQAAGERAKAKSGASGSELRFSVPYELLGLRPGAYVRIVFIERYGTKFDASSLLPEIKLALR
jgi:hypothetical protein